MINQKGYRYTAGIALGLRPGINSAVVVIGCKRDDTARTLYVVHEFERDVFSADTMAEALKVARELYRPVVTVGFYGGRDDEKVFRVLSIRLGQHIQPAPGDTIAPMQLLVDDVRTGRLKVRADSLVARDAKAAIWRDGVPSSTGILTALQCAHWGAQQYKQLHKPVTTLQSRLTQSRKERTRKQENPF